MSDEAKGLAVLITMIFTMILAVTVGDKTRCYATTAGMTNYTEWGILSGCRIQTEDGRMVPLESYQEIKLHQ